jgi:HrpA-like RNA helicase
LVKKLKLFRDLPLESKLSVESASDEASALLAEQVLNGNCPLKEWNDEVDQFIFRVIIHVLAPNQRPIQVTDDLSGFWKNSYPKIKLELQRKYPKHEWR